MSFLSEVFAFLVVGDARYGRDETPLDTLNRKAERGLDVAERMEDSNVRSVSQRRPVQRSSSEDR